MKKIYSFLVERLSFNEEQNRYLAKVILLSPIGGLGTLLIPALETIHKFVAQIDGFHAVQLSVTFSQYAAPLLVLLTAFFLAKRNESINPKRTLLPAIAALTAFAAFVHYRLWFVLQPAVFFNSEWELDIWAETMRYGFWLLVLTAAVSIASKKWPDRFLHIFYPLACVSAATVWMLLWVLLLNIFLFFTGLYT